MPRPTDHSAREAARLETRRRRSEAARARYRRERELSTLALNREQQEQIVDAIQDGLASHLQSASFRAPLSPPRNLPPPPPRFLPLAPAPAPLHVSAFPPLPSPFPLLSVAPQPPSVWATPRTQRRAIVRTAQTLELGSPSRRRTPTPRAGSPVRRLSQTNPQNPVDPNEFVVHPLGLPVDDQDEVDWPVEEHPTALPVPHPVSARQRCYKPQSFTAKGRSWRSCCIYKCTALCCIYRRLFYTFNRGLVVNSARSLKTNPPIDFTQLTINFSAHYHSKSRIKVKFTA